MAEKNCNRCNILKPLESFHRNNASSDGRRPECKVCFNSREKEKRYGEYPLKSYPDYSTIFGAKPCIHCLQIQPLDNFQPRAEHSDGFRNVCYQCTHYQITLRKSEKRPLIDQPDYISLLGVKPCAKCLQLKSPNQFYNKGDKYYTSYCKQCHQAHTDKWRQNNPERYLELGTIWAKDNPKRARQKSRERRTRRMKAKGEFTESEWKALKTQYSHRCLACGFHESEIETSDWYSVSIVPDHVKPLCKGGDNTIDNIQPLCISCNASKGDKYIDYRTEHPHQIQLSLW